jgi:hypothetical protein
MFMISTNNIKMIYCYNLHHTKIYMQIPRGEYLLVSIFTEVSYFTNLHFHKHVMYIEIHQTTRCPTYCRNEPLPQGFNAQQSPNI